MCVLCVFRVCLLYTCCVSFWCQSVIRRACGPYGHCRHAHPHTTTHPAALGNNSFHFVPVRRRRRIFFLFLLKAYKYLIQRVRNICIINDRISAHFFAFIHFFFFLFLLLFVVCCYYSVARVYDATRVGMDDSPWEGTHTFRIFLLQ